MEDQFEENQQIKDLDNAQQKGATKLSLEGLSIPKLENQLQKNIQNATLSSDFNQQLNRAAEFAQELTESHRTFDKNADGVVTYKEIQQQTGVHADFLKSNFEYLSKLDRSDKVDYRAGISKLDMTMLNVLFSDKDLAAAHSERALAGSVHGGIIGMGVGALTGGTALLGTMIAADSSTAIARGADRLASAVGYKTLVNAPILIGLAAGCYYGYRYWKNESQMHLNNKRNELLPIIPH